MTHTQTHTHIFSVWTRARVQTQTRLHTEAAATRQHPPHVSRFSQDSFKTFFLFLQNVKGFIFEGFSRMSAGLRRLPPSVPPHAALCSSVLSLHAERGGGRKGAREKARGTKTSNKINKNWKRKRKDQMHQKASGPQWGLPLSKRASLGNSANYSRPHKPSLGFCCFCGFAFGLI